MALLLDFSKSNYDRREKRGASCILSVSARWLSSCSGYIPGSSSLSTEARAAGARPEGHNSAQRVGQASSLAWDGRGNGPEGKQQCLASQINSLLAHRLQQYCSVLSLGFWFKLMVELNLVCFGNMPQECREGESISCVHQREVKWIMKAVFIMAKKKQVNMAWKILDINRKVVHAAEHTSSSFVASKLQGGAKLSSWQRWRWAAEGEGTGNKSHWALPWYLSQVHEMKSRLVVNWKVLE